MKTEFGFCDLVMDNGELIKIKFPLGIEDEFYESISNTLKRRNEWSPNQFEGCTAEYLGMLLDTVNMARVIGRM